MSFPPDGKLLDSTGSNIVRDGDKKKSPCINQEETTDYKRSSNWEQILTT